MKRLLPSLREKKRYIAFEIESENRLDKGDIINSVDSSCKNFMGEFSCGRAGLMVLNDTVNNNKGIIKIGNKYVDLAKTSLIMIKKINGNKVIFKNIKVSGSIGKLK